jgi:hypothetical protein
MQHCGRHHDDQKAGAHVFFEERVGVTYLQPLTKLLATLVNAQSSSAKGDVVDAGAVRAAVEEVNLVDRAHGEELLAKLRWAPLPEQIELALNKSVHVRTRSICTRCHWDLCKRYSLI